MRPNVAEWRRRRGWSQAELARRLGLSVRSVQRAEATGAAPLLLRLALQALDDGWTDYRVRPEGAVRRRYAVKPPRSPAGDRR